VIFGGLCVDCSTSSQLIAHLEGETGREALNQDPDLETDIASLLNLTSRIEELVSTRSRLRGAPLSGFFRRMSRFRLAVLSQQRDLQAATLPQTPRIEVRHENSCAACHKSMGTNHTAEGCEGDEFDESLTDERYDTGKGSAS
jgi:hypothetical protein